MRYPFLIVQIMNKLTKLLLLSSSKVGNTDYLEHALGDIADFLSFINPPYADKRKTNSSDILFIPYAGVTIDFDSYEALVKIAFAKIGLEITSIHHFENQKKAIENCKALVIGGGNTFSLLKHIYDFALLDDIKMTVNRGTAYIGWSAGSNIAGPTIKTTNDMPISEPPSFDALSLIPWQVNPHYLDGNPPGHNGETRQQRLEEFMVANPNQSVIAIPEGTGIKVTNGELQYIGNKQAYLFHHGKKQPFDTSENLAKLLQ